MRSRVPFLIFFFLISVAALPHFAFATQIPYFGPIVPTLNADCAGGWDGFVQLMNNAIAFLLTLAITTFAPIMIAYSGYLFVITPYSPGGKEKAKKILMNTITGIVVALSAWLIVDAILTTLTTGSSSGGGLTAWTSAMFSSSGDNPCLLINNEPITSSSALNSASGSTYQTLNGGSSTPISFSPSGTGSCQPTVVEQGASEGGYTISSAEGQTLACIAQQESSCGANDQNYNWGNGSSAFGPFQILLQTNSSCYNNNACDAAVNLPNGTSLNCQSGFSGGNPIPGSLAVQQCVQAAANTACSSAAAACLVQQNNGSFSAWASTNDQSCVQQYSK